VAFTRQVPSRARRSGPHVRPGRRVAAHPLTLAGLGCALAAGQHRLAAADDEPRPAGDRPAVLNAAPRIPTNRPALGYPIKNITFSGKLTVPALAMHTMGTG